MSWGSFDMKKNEEGGGWLNLISKVFLDLVTGLLRECRGLLHFINMETVHCNLRLSFSDFL